MHFRVGQAFSTCRLVRSPLSVAFRGQQLLRRYLDVDAAASGDAAARAAAYARSEHRRNVLASAADLPRACRDGLVDAVMGCLLTLLAT